MKKQSNNSFFSLNGSTSETSSTSEPTTTAIPTTAIPTTTVYPFCGLWNDLEVSFVNQKNDKIIRRDNKRTTRNEKRTIRDNYLFVVNQLEKLRMSITTLQGMNDTQKAAKKAAIQSWLTANQDKLNTALGKRRTKVLLYCDMTFNQLQDAYNQNIINSNIKSGIVDSTNSEIAILNTAIAKLNSEIVYTNSLIQALEQNLENNNCPA
jgi:hypothetical protein